MTISKACTSLLLLTAVAGTARAALSVSLTSNMGSPRPVGSSITWTATAKGDTDPAPQYVYKFTAELAGLPRVTRAGFQKSNKIVWTPSALDGNYTVDVVVKNLNTGTTASATVNYTITSLAGANSAVNATAHPLVALFSGPACRMPNTMRVVYAPTTPVPAGGITSPTSTSPMPCNFDTTSASPITSSMNFYIGGLYPSTTYSMHWETVRPNGTIIYTGPNLTFTTAAIPASVNLPVFTPTGVSGSPEDAIMLHNVITIPVNGKLLTSSATDLKGNVLWYSTNGQPTRTEFDGSYWAFPPGIDMWNPGLRQVDLAGNTIVETTVGDVNLQLAAMGKRPITTFHHEARRIFRRDGALPSGYVMVIASTEFVVTNAGQCGSTNGIPNTCDVLADAIVVLDQNLNVVWAFDIADNLDVSQRALLNEVCTGTAGGGCPPVFMPGFTQANDWTHSNSLQYTPYDGNIVISVRHLDAVMKVNFGDGAGDGKVRWVFSKYPLKDNNGDPLPSFALATNSTGGQHDIGYPWFSHQHDFEVEYGGFLFPNDFRVFTLFDNGNLRQETYNTQAHSRCQIFAMNEDLMVANLNTNADVGSYSFAIGTAQMLTNGSVSCDSGFIGGFPAATTNPRTDSTESRQDGEFVYKLSAVQNSYRTFRMKNLYTPVNP